MIPRLSVHDVAEILKSYPIAGMRQLNSDGRYRYYIAFYYPKDGRKGVIDQLDSLGLARDDRHTATVYMGGEFELRIGKFPSVSRDMYNRPNSRTGAIVLLLTEGQKTIYDRFNRTKESLSNV